MLFDTDDSIIDELAIDTVGLSERNLEILRLYLNGYTHAEIGKRVKLSESRVANIVTEYGFSKFRMRREEAKLKRFANDYLEREEIRKSGRRSIFGCPPLGVRVKAELHPGQREAYDTIKANQASATPAMVTSIICGRGWGKTFFLGALLVEYLQDNPGAQVLWVAPYISSCMSLVEDFFQGWNDITGERLIDDEDENGNRVWQFSTTKSGPVLRWWNGATVTFRSAENPEAIVSRGYSRVIFDEHCLVNDDLVFRQRILGVARKKLARIFLISTPRGMNWGYQLFQKGLDPSETKYLSIHQPYHRNPHYNPALADLIKDLPEFLFRQEYLAEFISDNQAVLKGIEKCIHGPEISFPDTQQEWCPEVYSTADRRFVVGMDLAKSIDFTVLYAMDIDTGECVYYRRMNKKDYKEVLQLAGDLCKRLGNATLVYDSTGVGAGLSDFIDSYGVDCRSFSFTNESKTELINRLALSIEHEKIKIPNIPTILKELRTYAFEITKTGKISYNAPPGGHDDTVIALALANLLREENLLTKVECEVFDRVIQINSGIGAHQSFWDYMMNDND